MWMNLVLAWMLLVSGSGTPAEQVELFDTDQEKVTRSFKNSENFQKEAREILQSVDKRVLELSPSLEHALIVKIPLEPPQKLKIKDANLDAEILRMFIVLPKKSARSPWLILQTKDGETVIVEFTEKLDRMLKLLEKT